MVSWPLQLDGERSEHRKQSNRAAMPTKSLRLLAVLAIPLFLLLHAPVLAALVPGALLTMASLDSKQDERRALPAATVVTEDDLLDVQRAAAATPVYGTSRRIG